MTGPYETGREVTQTPQVQAVYAAFEAAPGAGRMKPHNLAMLMDACADAGVAVGAYDSRILGWLAQWEPQTCAVVAGLITRARQAAGIVLDPVELECVLDALADAAAYRKRQAGEACADCDAAADEHLCPDHLADYDAADCYDDLAELLRMEAGR
jgi:hypothetical protein